jgi:hypothetical protein
MRYTRSGRLSWYEIIPPESVRPAYMVALADAVVEWAAQDLSLGTSPKVTWFIGRTGVPPFIQTNGKTEIVLTDEQWQNIRLNDHGPRIGGLFMSDYPGEVFIRTRRCPYTLAHTVLHEVRHAWQHQTGWSFSSCDGLKRKGQRRPVHEVDAAAYVHPLLGQMIPLVHRFSRRK